MQLHTYGGAFHQCPRDSKSLPRCYRRSRQACRVRHCGSPRVALDVKKKVPGGDMSPHLDYPYRTYKWVVFLVSSTSKHHFSRVLIQRLIHNDLCGVPHMHCFYQQSIPIRSGGTLRWNLPIRKVCFKYLGAILRGCPFAQAHSLSPLPFKSPSCVSAVSTKFRSCWQALMRPRAL